MSNSMEALGEYLKCARRQKGKSLSDVYGETGITASRLSKLERGLLPEPSAEMLCKIASCYELDIIAVLVVAGYVAQITVRQAGFFSHTEYLSELERTAVQGIINAMTIERQGY